MDKENFKLTPPNKERQEASNHTPFRIIRSENGSPSMGLQFADQEHRLNPASEKQLENFRIQPAQKKQEPDQKQNPYALHRGPFELQADPAAKRDFTVQEKAVIPQDAKKLPIRDEKAKNGPQERRSSSDMMHVTLSPMEQIRQIRESRNIEARHPSTAELEKRDAEIIARLRKQMQDAGIVPADTLDKHPTSNTVKEHQKHEEVLADGAKARRDRDIPSKEVDPETHSIHEALKTQGMLGIDSQIAEVKRIIEAEKKASGRTLTIDQAIQEMRHGKEEEKDPSFPKEEKYQEDAADGARERAKYKEAPPGPPQKPSPEEIKADDELDYFKHSKPSPEEKDTLNNPETLVKERLAYQQNYLDKIRARYTVAKLKQLVEETRTGETTADYQARKKEAIRLQSFLYSLNRDPKDYIQELEAVNNSLPPMSPEAKMSILIPAYNEADRIERTLETWTLQQKKEDGSPTNPSEMEIMILVNRPNESAGFDRTREVVESFKKAHPDFAGSIQVVEKTFNFPKVKKKSGDQEKEYPDVKMGTIYRYLTDLAVVRNVQRLSQGAPEAVVANHIMRTGGADVYKRSPYHVAHIVESFQDQELEQYVSLSNYSPEVYRKLPLLFVAKQIQEEMNEQLTQGLSHIGLGTYRSALYAEAGGFEQSMKVAEEMELSKRIRKVLRKKGGPLQHYRKRDMILNALDDPRRDIATLYQGRAITRAYEDYQENQTVRSMDISQIIAEDVPVAAQLTPENLSVQADGIFKLYLDLYFDPENGVGEPQSTEMTINNFISVIEKIGLPKESVHIMYDGKPFDIKTYAAYVKKSSEPINEIRKKFQIKIDATPPLNTVSSLIQKQYEDAQGSWVTEEHTATGEHENQKVTKARNTWKKVTGGAKGFLNRMHLSRKRPEQNPHEQEVNTEIQEQPEQPEPPQQPQQTEQPEQPQVERRKLVEDFITDNNITIDSVTREKLVVYMKTHNNTTPAEAYVAIQKEQKEADERAEAESPQTEESQTPEKNDETPVEDEAEEKPAEQVQQTPSSENDTVQEAPSAISAGPDTQAVQGSEQYTEEKLQQDLASIQQFKKTSGISNITARFRRKKESGSSDSDVKETLQRVLEHGEDFNTYQTDTSAMSDTVNYRLALQICDPSNRTLELIQDNIRNMTSQDQDLAKAKHTAELFVDKADIGSNFRTLSRWKDKKGHIFKGKVAAILMFKDIHPTQLANVLGIPEARSFLLEVLGKQAVHSPDEGQGNNT